MKNILQVLCVLAGIRGYSQSQIIPRPNEMRIDTGAFIVTPATTVIYGTGAKKFADYFRTECRKRFGILLNSAPYSATRPKRLINSIQIFLRDDTARSRAYFLKITKNAVYLDSHNDTLLFNGLQTVLQLFPKSDLRKLKFKLVLPQTEILDYPRFSYRGMHLDVSRHFFRMAEVKRYIDKLAFYKFNNFHWHLTDDQGWRI